MNGIISPPAIARVFAGARIDIIMSVSSNLMGEGWPKATPSITVVLGVGLCWPQVVLWVPLATNGVMLWVLVTKLVVMPGVLGILLIVVVSV